MALVDVSNDPAHARGAKAAGFSIPGLTKPALVAEKPAAKASKASKAAKTADGAAKATRKRAPGAKKAAALFGLSEAEERMLNEVPYRGMPMPPTDPTELLARPSPLEPPRVLPPSLALMCVGRSSQLRTTPNATDLSHGPL